LSSKLCAIKTSEERSKLSKQGTKCAFELKSYTEAALRLKGNRGCIFFRDGWNGMKASKKEFTIPATGYSRKQINIAF
jgi:hypothetical protein